MDYILLRSKNRHRSIALKFNHAGKLTVYAPQHTPKLLINQFIRSKRTWIKQQQLKLASLKPPTPYFDTHQTLELFIHQQIKLYSSLLKLYPTQIKFKQVKSYWGNCHSSGRLTFNYALQFAPPKVVVYVVIHELAHLKYKGHNSQFWNFVKQVYPQTTQARRLLALLSSNLIP